MNFNLDARTILVTIGGSRAYGMHTSTSDIDIKGVCIAPEKYYLGYFDHFEQADKSSELKVFSSYLTADEEDIVSSTKLEGSIYEIKKFFNLAAECNPNILDVLFCRDNEVRKITSFGKKLRDNADLFISAKAKHSFSGYAICQLKRIETHRKWLISPPDHKPTRQEYDLSDKPLISKEQIAAVWSMVQKQMDTWNFDFNMVPDAGRIHLLDQIEKTIVELGATTEGRWKQAGRLLGFDENFIHFLDRERRYNAANTEYKQYENWKVTRNPERAALEAKHGLDTKHATHLVRLLRMGKEILLTGKVNVWREDHEELLSIRNGEWDYDKIVGFAKELDLELNSLYKNKQYVVPHKPDHDKLIELNISLIKEFLEG